jgi:hypothetical protein
MGKKLTKVCVEKKLIERIHTCTHMIMCAVYGVLYKKENINNKILHCMNALHVYFLFFINMQHSYQIIG